MGKAPRRGPASPSTLAHACGSALDTQANSFTHKPPSQSLPHLGLGAHDRLGRCLNVVRRRRILPQLLKRRCAQQPLRELDGPQRRERQQRVAVGSAVVGRARALRAGGAREHHAQQQVGPADELRSAAEESERAVGGARLPRCLVLPWGGGGGRRLGGLTAGPPRSDEARAGQAEGPQGHPGIPMRAGDATRAQHTSAAQGRAIA